MLKECLSVKRFEMVFSSVIFVWVFLPIVLITYYAVAAALRNTADKGQRAKNIVLLVSSVVFYCIGGYKYLLLLMGVLAINYTGGLLVDKATEKKPRLAALSCTVALNLALLFFFKYLNLFVRIYDNFTYAAGGNGTWSEGFMNMLKLQSTGQLEFVDIVLPIGISFYIFQSISYVVDVYRKDAGVQRNFFDFSLYVSFFPQLIAGPIVKYSDVDTAIRGRKETLALFGEGVSRFIYGMAKKVLIANTVASVADEIWKINPERLGASVTWLAAVCYTLQIYFDFSGYSDMAIGLGKMFGFEFRENFNYPYISGSVQEFWRRWHISLSTWFKEYVYIPLGGSRCSKAKLLRNIFIVFLLTGVWHGANFTFLMWGLMYAVLLMLERLFLGKILSKKWVKPIGHIYALFFVIIGWVIFRSDNIVQAFGFIGKMFVAGSGEYSIFSFISVRVVLAIVFGIILSFPVFRGIKNAVAALPEKGREVLGVVETVWQIVLFAYSVIVIVSGSYNPFIYFQF